MKAKSIDKYIIVGTRLRYLQDCKEGFPIHGDKFVIKNIECFLNDLEELNLNVTRRASGNLEAFYKKLKREKKDSKISKAQAVEISSIMTNLRQTFFAESEGILAYVVDDKRYDTRKLIDDISELFQPGIFYYLPSISKYDFEEAGKCIAFQRPTAAAFHLLRGIEANLKKYHKCFFRGNNDSKTWGTLINELRNKTRGKIPNLVTVNHLDNIRSSFRNPTQHPEKTYEIQEVQDLLGLTIDVINRMINETKKYYTQHGQ